VAATEGDAVGVGDIDGDTDGDSLAEDEGVGAGFFFAVDFLWRFGVGVGVGPAKNRLILSPSDSVSGVPRASTDTAIDAIIAVTSKERVVILVATLSTLLLPVLAAQPGSFACQRRDSPAENFRSANARDNHAAPIQATRFPRQEYREILRQSECCRLRE
jgi:hypothetical protein